LELALATDVSGLPDEIDAALNSGDADDSTDSGVGTGINRSLPGTKPGHGNSLSSKPKSNPAIESVEGSRRQ